MIIVSRHSGLVEWLAERGITGKVITHIEDPAEIESEVVVGNLPLSLAAKTAAVIAVDMPNLSPEQRGKDLTPAEMDAAGAEISVYYVRRLGDWTSESFIRYVAKNYDGIRREYK